MISEMFRGLMGRSADAAESLSARYVASVRDALGTNAFPADDIFTPSYMGQRVGWTDEAELQRLKPFFGYNHFTDRLLQLTRNNVIGADSIVLEAVRRDAPSALGVQRNWAEWTRSPLADSRRSWRDFIDTLHDDTAKWGELYLWLKRMPARSDVPDGLRYRYQVLTPNDLRPEYSDLHPSIVLNKETGMPSRYYFKQRVNNGVPIPAQDIIQVFWPRRAIDGRGISWFRKIRKPLDLLYLLETGHLEHAIKLARVPGYVRLPRRMYNALIGFDPNTDEEIDMDEVDQRASQHQIPTSTDGVSYLPEDGDWLKIDSALNPSAYQNLRRGAIASIAVGWGINYNTVASDLAGINFTTGRMAKLEDETFYLEVRAWLQDVIEQVFWHWAERTFQMTENTMMFKFNYREYKYLDPRGQTQSDKIALENGTTSRRRIAARDGNNIDDIFDELEAEAVRMAEIERARQGGNDDDAADDGTDGGDDGERDDEQREPAFPFSRNGAAVTD